jgi:hypothetical protein
VYDHRLMTIDPAVERAYQAILRHFLEEGRAPGFDELAERLGVDVAEARRLQAQAIAKSVGTWTLPDSDVIESFAPFQTTPTAVRLSVDDGREWWGQCFLEGFASRYVLPDQDIRMEVRCLDCDGTTTVLMREGDLLEVDPESAVGIMNQPLNPQLRVGVGSSYF